MTDPVQSGETSAQAASPDSAGANSAASTPTPAFGVFTETRGSGLARGKRPSQNAAPAAAAITGEYKPTALEVITPEREYKNPFSGETSSPRAESKNKNIHKVFESFKQQYKNILEDDEIDKLNNIYINNKNCGGNNMENVIKGNSVDSTVVEVGLDVEKAQIKKDRLELTIDQLNAKKDLAEKEISLIIAQSDDANAELVAIKSNINTKTGELDALAKTKISYEDELATKKSEIDAIDAIIESKQLELKEAEELKVLESKNDKSTVILKKRGKVFSTENKPVVRVVSPDERIAKSSWASVNTDEIRKIAYLSEDMNDCFAFIDKTESGWEKYKYPVYQIFPSDEDGIDFDLVINTSGLKTALTFMQSKTGAALDIKEKKAMYKYFAKKYKTLEEIGQAEIPETLKKVSESKVVFETSKAYLDIFLEGLLSDNIIDLDESEVVEQSETDEDVLIKLDDENTANALQTIAVTLSTLLSGDEIVIDDTNTSNTEDVVEEQPKQIKISNDDARKVVEQFNPDDASLDVNKELTEFVEMLLTNEDGTPTAFADTYELKDGSDIYAMYGVIKDSFVNGDFTTSLQILKALTGTIFVNLKNADQTDVQSTEKTEDIPTIADATATDTSLAPTDSSVTDPAAPITDVSSDATVTLSDVQIINYAFNMSTLVLAKYDELQDVFTSIGTPNIDSNELVPAIDTTVPDTIPLGEQTIENNEQTIYEQTNNDNNGGIEMDATKLIEMIKDNFESQDEINEENVLEAVSSIIADFAEMAEKYNAVETELNEIKLKEVDSLKNEKTRTLESLGLEKTAIDEAFASVTTSEEIEAKFEELSKVVASVNKVTESTQKMPLTRKGTANPDESVVITANTKDSFDKLMDSI